MRRTALLRTRPIAIGAQAPAVRFRSSMTATATPTLATDEEVKPFSEVPGPKPLPVLGNLWRFFPGGDFAGVAPYDIPDTLVRRYGPIVKLEGMLTDTKLFVADPTAAQQIFRTEGQWPIREGISSIDYYYKNYRKNLQFSLGTANGEVWQKFRSAVNQVAVQPRNVKVYVEPINAVAEEFIQRMKSIRDANQQMPDDFTTEIKKWAAESITYVALDTRLGMLENNIHPDSDAGRLVELVKNTFDAMAKLEFGLSPWKYISTPTWRQLKSSMDTFTEMATRHVNEVVDRLSKLSEEEIASRQFSVLERLLVNSHDSDKGVAFALDMMLAGIDTTAHQTSSLLYFLATHPEQQRALQAELDREWEAGQPLTASVLEKLKYLRACIKEAMRLQAVVTGILRTANQDVVLNGYLIPKGTHTIVCTKTMCRDERLVPRASEYLPERWLPGQEQLKPRHAFVNIPFGFGPRMCAGKRFADLEMEVLCARLFRSHNLEWHHPEPQVEQKLFVQYSSPLKITMKER
ncbi:Cytochrome P450 CYP301 [Frankliniella occidentalis]|uniref:Probable cytochrome P450 301a1, mitochondrial n=2 Tax=Frankliniella occidentalis TaxID=133901 RepID=A0A6J1T408_FRAOC|nr:probable cytochrome P450 301a1, mitochondrial [Frankliniella occidentalis]KAE8748023.1 Cytochrome P450 CYP301 [Frankliniella occidentalis]